MHYLSLQLSIRRQRQMCIRDRFIDRMVGGVFEGSNDAGFRTRDTLFVIEEKPVRLQNVVYVSNPKEYRYLRYYGPAGSYCNVSEVGFYRDPNDMVPLQGRVIGTPGSFGGDKGHWYMLSRIHI